MELRRGCCSWHVMVTLILTHQFLVLFIWIQHELQATDTILVNPAEASSFGFQNIRSGSVNPNARMKEAGFNKPRPTANHSSLAPDRDHDMKALPVAPSVVRANDSLHGNNISKAHLEVKAGKVEKNASQLQSSQSRLAAPAAKLKTGILQSVLTNDTIGKNLPTNLTSGCIKGNNTRVKGSCEKSVTYPITVITNFTSFETQISLKVSKQLVSKVTSYCEGNIKIFNKTIALFRGVLIDPSRATAGASGGEELETVMGQKDEAEFYEFRRGFLTVLKCNKYDPPPILPVQGNAPHVALLNAAVAVRSNAKSEHKEQNATQPEVSSDSRFVLAITRYEYANVYWVVVELYDAFLTMRIHNRTFQDTDLLILDAHPGTPLDGLHEGLFRKTLRPPQLQAATKVDALVFNFARQYSPQLVRNDAPIPLIRDFRYQVLKALKIPILTPASRHARCHGNNLTMTIIWRHDYVAHPRNAAGIVARKIANEGALLEAAEKAFPTYNIRGVQLDNLTAHAQLELVAQTDLLVGMHGAAMAYSVFLPLGSAVLEMWPHSKSTGANWHMKKLAVGSGHFYTEWRNNYIRKEVKETKSTNVTTGEVVFAVRGLVKDICKGLKL